MGDRFNYIANYSICNPITSQWIDLPPHSRPFRFVSKGFVTRVEGGILTSYRVVRLNVLLRRTNIIKFEVFSSEIGEWKDFDVHIDLKIQFAWPGRPAFLNGILHWITREHVILAYDPYHPENVHIIALPIDIHIASTNNALPSFYDVYVHQGRLSYFEMADLSIRPNGFSRISIWVLNDYSTGDWSLQHRIDSSEILYDGILSGQNLSLKPINFHPFDSDVLYLGCNNMIVSYNIKIRKLEAHDIEDSYKIRPCWWSAFLLVIPLWPIYIPPPSFGVTEV